MKLYYNPLSTYSQKAIIALNEKGVSYTPEVVSLMDPDSRAAYEKVYPIGKLPLLVLDDGHMIPESTIIIEYLEGHHPGGTRLIPEGTDPSRKARFHDRMADLYLNDASTTVLFDQFKFVEILPADVAKAKHRLDIMFGYLDKHLAENKWMCGDEFSMADCAVIPPLYYLDYVYPYKNANIKRYWEQAQQRPSYQKVRAEFEPIWKGLLSSRG